MEQNEFIILRCKFNENYHYVDQMIKNHGEIRSAVKKIHKKTNSLYLRKFLPTKE